MKKILCLLFVIFVSSVSVYAKDIDKQSIRYNGEKYYLMYSTENKESGGYLNEYYKLGENYYNWSEMVAVHSFPSVQSPFDQIRLFKKYLAEKNCKGTVTFDDKKNAAIIDFVMINDKNVPNILEFNIFKYQQTPKDGSVALQYVKRYTATTTLQAQAAKKEFEKCRKDAIKDVISYKIPAVIRQEYDKYKVADSNTKDLINIQKKEEIKKEPAPKEEIQQQEQKKEQQDVAAKTDAENIEKEVKSDSDTAKVKEEHVVTVNEKKEGISIEKTPSEIELIQKQPGYDKDIYPVKTNKKLKKEAVKQEKQEKEVYAPLPLTDTVNSEETKVKKSKKEKKEKKVKSKDKEKSYQVVNSKEDFYAKPVKRKNISPKKAAKQKAKESAKKLKENL